MERGCTEQLQTESSLHPVWFVRIEQTTTPLARPDNQWALPRRPSTTVQTLPDFSDPMFITSPDSMRGRCLKEENCSTSSQTDRDRQTETDREREREIHVSSSPLFNLHAAQSCTNQPRITCKGPEDPPGSLSVETMKHAKTKCQNSEKVWTHVGWKNDKESSLQREKT